MLRIECNKNRIFTFLACNKAGIHAFQQEFMTGKLAAALCYVKAASNWFYTNIIVEVREFRLVTYGILIVAWHMNCGLWYVNCGLWYKCG